MAKDPAFLFYPQDFLVGTAFMTHDEVGAYIRIICHLADKGRLSMFQLKAICGSDPSKSIMDKLLIDREGFFYNKRLANETEKRKNFCNSRKNNRLRKYHMSNICKTYVQHMENENVNENEDKNKDENLNKDESKKVPKSIEQAKEYFLEIGISQEAEAFWDHFSSNGWRVGGKAPMKDWKSAARNWKRNMKNNKAVHAKQKASPDTQCTGCYGTGKLPDGVKCWCWK